MQIEILRALGEPYVRSDGRHAITFQRLNEQQPRYIERTIKKLTVLKRFWRGKLLRWK